MLLTIMFSWCGMCSCRLLCTWANCTVIYPQWFTTQFRTYRQDRDAHLGSHILDVDVVYQEPLLEEQDDRGFGLGCHVLRRSTKSAQLIGEHTSFGYETHGLCSGAFLHWCVNCSVVYHLVFWPGCSEVEQTGASSQFYDKFSMYSLCIFTIEIF